MGLFAGLYYSMSRLLPSGPGGLTYQARDATRIYSSDGVLLARLYEENRDVIGIEKIPKDLQNATIAIEDKRFYQHVGFDPYGIARAMWINVRGGSMEQGASTITQQLARNIYLSRKKTIARKLQEIAMAMAIERRFSKQQILEMYLNEVYYGSGAYGVESAAQTYFGKHTSGLTLPECALIAGLPQRPSGYSPFNDMDASVGRRNVVIQKMADQGFITTETAQQAMAATVHLAHKPADLRWRAPYFVSYVIQQLGDEYGESTIHNGGLRIYTTLDYRMQETAEDAVRNGVRRFRNLRVGQGALIAMDPQTGGIRAMVGGTDFNKNQFNVVTQGHPQPGSTFKPFVYTAALESGKTIYSRVPDKRVWLRGRNEAPWPQNYDHRYRNRDVSYLEAVRWSINVPAVLVAKEIGIDKVIRYARALGVTSALPEDLTMALGSASLTPLEMARAYCAFANGGEAVTSTCVSRVTTADGGVLKDYTPSRQRAMRQSTAEGIDTMLRAVVTSGTGHYVYSRVPNARGKTGTTDQNMHAWFIGYTPELVTAVWVGNDKPRPMLQVWGGNVCAPIWSDFMRVAVPIQKTANMHKARPEAQQDNQPAETRQSTPRRRNHDGVTAPDAGNQGQQPSGDGSTPPDQQPEGETPSTPAPDGQQGEQPSSGARASGTEYITVLECAETGLLANTNCPHVVRKRVRADLAPTQVCGRH